MIAPCHASPRGLHLSFELAPSGSHGRVALQAEQRNVDLAGMRGGEESGFERHRAADVTSRRHRRLDVAAAARGGEWDCVAGEQRFCLAE